MKLKLFLIVLLVLLGVWMGVNFAQDKPLFSNPFADKELRQRASERASEVVEKSREAIERKLKVPD